MRSAVQTLERTATTRLRNRRHPANFEKQTSRKAKKPCRARNYNFSNGGPGRELNPDMGIFNPLTGHPHLLYPQFKHVAHPSISTSAFVLHLWHMVADGGKLAPSPVMAMSSG